MSSANDDRRQPRPIQNELEVDKLFRALAKLEGSDLHLKIGCPPYVRINGALHPLSRGPIDAEEMSRLVKPLIDAKDRLKRILDDEGGVDFAHLLEIDGKRCRFRVNVFQQMGMTGLIGRRVNNIIPTFAELNLPASLENLCKFPQGMVLVAGITGAGKSTTIAAMLDWINHHYRRHILTLEDPIEFTFTEDKCLVTQRELGMDVKDFQLGMKQAVREDPDVVLIGEMRDRETFNAAMQAAETGHLIFSSIHASSAASSIGRILDLFPTEMHGLVRHSLAFNVKAIVVQKLVKCLDEKVGRVPIVEIMLFSPMVKKLIMEEQDEKLPDAIRIARDEGMQDFTMSLKNLVDRDMIDRTTAFDVAPNPEALKMALRGIEVRDPGIL
jgi:twitching motility protein PilT